MKQGRNYEIKSEVQVTGKFQVAFVCKTTRKAKVNALLWCLVISFIISTLFSPRTLLERITPLLKETIMNARFEVLTVVATSSYVACDVTSWSPLKVNRRFGGIYRLHFLGQRISQEILLVRYVV
jgi:hypothetical protein